MGKMGSGSDPGCGGEVEPTEQSGSSVSGKCPPACPWRRFQVPRVRTAAPDSLLGSWWLVPPYVLYGTPPQGSPLRKDCTIYTTCMNTHAPHTTGLYFLRPGAKASPGAERPSRPASTRGVVFRDRNDLSTENSHLESQDPGPLWSHPSWKALPNPFPQPGGPFPNLLG